MGCFFLSLLFEAAFFRQLLEAALLLNQPGRQFFA
jgi:hypothetical protein